MKRITLTLILLAFLFSGTGCFESLEEQNASLDALIDIAKAAQTANAASAPINPYVFPIGAGLAGLIPLLEALRRKERSARKHAEGKLNNGTNDK